VIKIKYFDLFPDSKIAKIYDIISLYDEDNSFCKSEIAKESFCTYRYVHNVFIHFQLLKIIIFDKIYKKKKLYKFNKQWRGIKNDTIR